MTSEFVLGVDLDGVCGDYTEAFRQIVALERSIDPSSLPSVRDWSFSDWGLSPEEFDALHRRAVIDHRMFATMPAMDGVADALWQLSDLGVWIRVITHRLYVSWGHAIAVADTVSWLDSVGIPYRDLCFLGQKPQVEADLYIDDAPHNVEALRAAGNEVIVFDQPYNQGLAAPRAYGWHDVVQLVTDAIAADRPVQEPLPGIGSGSGRLAAGLPRGPFYTVPAGTDRERTDTSEPIR